MCGIVLVSGPGSENRVRRGLARLRYRGYDSYGFGWVSDTGLDDWRSTEDLDDMVETLPASTLALGHTRWATHGGVTVENAHPHRSQRGAFLLVHNGIVENAAALSVAAGLDWRGGDSDTALVVRLIDRQLDRGVILQEALASVFADIEGRNALVVLADCGTAFAIRHGSPLLAGRGAGHAYLASDALSIAPFADECQPLPEGTVCSLEPGESFTGLRDHWQPITASAEDLELEGHSHYMIKEIMEQWQTIPRQFQVDQAGFDEFAALVRQKGRLLVTGAGGAAITAGHIAHAIRQETGLMVIDAPAYDIGSWLPLAQKGDPLLAVSQSGETADTLAAVEAAKTRGLIIASLTNMPHAGLPAASAFAFANHCGPEVCVLSTKSATAQMAFGARLTRRLAGADAFPADQLATELSQYLDDSLSERVKPVAAAVAGRDHLYVLGQGAHLWSARMAALNIKEASYIHAEAFSTGELKHGVIALIEPGTPVVVFDHGGLTDNAVAEVSARGAVVIAISNRVVPGATWHLPLAGGCDDPLGAGIADIIPGQLLAYHLALSRGLNPDRPRNLAKSVTVM